MILTETDWDPDDFAVRYKSRQLLWITFFFYLFLDLYSSAFDTAGGCSWKSKAEAKTATNTP